MLPVTMIVQVFNKKTKIYRTMNILVPIFLKGHGCKVRGAFRLHLTFVPAKQVLLLDLIGAPNFEQARCTLSTRRSPTEKKYGSSKSVDLTPRNAYNHQEKINKALQKN